MSFTLIVSLPYVYIMTFLVLADNVLMTPHSNDSAVAVMCSYYSPIVLTC